MSSVTQAERRDITRAAARWLALLDAEEAALAAEQIADSVLVRDRSLRRSAEHQAKTSDKGAFEHLFLFLRQPCLIFRIPS